MVTRRVIGLFIAFAVVLAGVWAATTEREPITEEEAHHVARRKLERLPSYAVGEDFGVPKVTPYETEGDVPTSWMFEYRSQGRPRYEAWVLVDRWGGTEFVGFNRILTEDEAREHAAEHLRRFCIAQGLPPESFRIDSVRQGMDRAIISTDSPGWTFETAPLDGTEAELTLAMFEDGRYYIRLRSQDGEVLHRGEVELQDE